MKLTIFQERLSLPVIGYVGTERVSQSHFIDPPELSEIIWSHKFDDPFKSIYLNKDDFWWNHSSN